MRELIVFVTISLCMSLTAMATSHMTNRNGNDQFAKSHTSIQNKPYSHGKKLLFVDDKRLSMLISVKNPGTTLGSILRVISRDTKVKFSTENADRELELAPIAVMFDKRPLREVMDGLVSLNALQWRQNADKSYTVFSSSSAYEIYLATNQWSKERNEIGKRFVADLDALSPQDKQKVAAWDSGAYIDFSSIPSGLHGNLKSLASTLVSQGGAQGFRLPFNDGNIDTSRVQVKVQHKERGFDVYKINFGKRNVGSMMLSFNNYEDLKDDKKDGRSIYNPNLQRRISVANKVSEGDERLERLVVLNLGNVTMEEAVRILAQKSGLCMVTESNRVTPSRFPVNYGTITVRTALSRLAVSSPKSIWAWEFRPDSATIVMRNSMNPAFPHSSDERTRTLTPPGRLSIQKVWRRPVR